MRPQKGSTTTHRPLCVGLCVVACLASGNLAAEGLALQQVIDTTLHTSVGVRLARSQLRAGEGSLLITQSLFDPILSSAGSTTTSNDPVLTGSSTSQTTDSASASLSRRFRSGLRLTPSLSIDRIDVENATAVSTGTVNLSLLAPLLENRWGKGDRLRVESAEVAYEGDRWNLTHQSALSVFQAADAYWSYVAASKNLEVFRISQRRAEQLVSEMRQLVDVEERPAADLIQVEGNASSKQIDTLSAEQSLIVARRSLGLAMGIPGPAIEALQLPSDGFPATVPFTADADAVEALIELALERRADLEAEYKDQESARLSLEADRDDLKPSLDLTVSAGYSGIDAGSGLDPLLGALTERISGLETTVRLSYQLPIRNDAAQGAALRSQSILEQQQILTEDLERRVRTAVLVAAEALERAALRALAAEQTVRLNRTTVDNEKKKSLLGLATLFDVILAEDRLTSALLNQVSAQQAYASAVASLRFETATLIDDPDTARAAVEAFNLTVPPDPEALAASPARGTGSAGGGTGSPPERLR
ncbi:MAG: TolC family protein [Acidobacteriota bacterium]